MNGWPAEDYGCSKNTPTGIFSIFRQVVCCGALGSLHEECRPGELYFKVGGPGVYVEIDKARR